jgi:hypothetical protein
MAQKVFTKSDGFDRLTHQNLGAVVSKYYYTGEEEPRIKMWTAGEELDSERFEHGDIHIETSDSQINAEIDNLFDIFDEIKNYDCSCADESIIPNSEPVFEFEGEVIKFLYFKSESGNRYFVFEYAHPKESKKVVKKLPSS